MKIKCPCYPWCNTQLELDKKTIGDHLFSKHRLDEVCMVLTEKIFKIHEKIESLDKGLYNKKIEDIGRDGYLSAETATRQGQIEILKSLLENKK